MGKPPVGVYREPQSEGAAKRPRLVFSGARVDFNATSAVVRRSSRHDLGSTANPWSSRVVEVEFSLPAEPVLGEINSWGFAEDVALQGGLLTIYRTEDEGSASAYINDGLLRVDLTLGAANFADLWNEMMQRPMCRFRLEISLSTLAAEIRQDTSHLKATRFLRTFHQPDETEPADAGGYVTVGITLVDEWTGPL